MSKKRFSADQWREWFDEFERSSLTVEQFCRSKQTTANTFYNWRKKLKKVGASVESGQLPEFQTFPSGEFVPVTLSATPIEIELPGGSILRMPSDRHSIEPVLQVLFDLARQS